MIERWAKAHPTYYHFGDVNEMIIEQNPKDIIGAIHRILPVT